MSGCLESEEQQNQVSSGPYSVDHITEVLLSLISPGRAEYLSPHFLERATEAKNSGLSRVTQ
jgi:hypothetical protein